MRTGSLTDPVAVRPGDADRQHRMSLIEEGTERQVCMAHLAIAGHHSVNGVAALHFELLKTRLVSDFAVLWPERFTVDPGSLFDVQAKRIHEHKRQLLAVLGIIHAHLACVEERVVPAVARTHIFCGRTRGGGLKTGRMADSPLRQTAKKSLETASKIRPCDLGLAQRMPSAFSSSSDGAKKVAPETGRVKSIRWSCKPSPAAPIIRLNIRSGMPRSFV